MLTPKRIKLKNIGRFVTEQVIEFDDLGNLIQVDADNRNTGGSSGAGKSTVFNAMDYLLGLNDLPVTVLQSRLTKEGILVVGEFDWDGKQVELTRGKGKLSITVDGTTTEGANKLVEEKIDEMLGMSRDLFRSIFHKRQKEGGFFLKMTPSTTHQFLTDVLNLHAEQKKVEKVEADIKSTIAKKQELERIMEAWKGGLKASQDAILDLGLAPVRDIHQSVVLDLKQKYDASLAALKAIEDAHKQQNQVLDQQRPVLEAIPQPTQPQLDSTPFDATLLHQAEANKAAIAKETEQVREAERARLNSVNQKISELKINASVLRQKVTQAATAKNEALRVAAEIKQIRECICPTCQQQWVAEAAKVKEADLMASLNIFKAQIAEGALAEQEITKAEAEIGALTAQAQPQFDPNEADRMKRAMEAEGTIQLERQKMAEHQAKQSAANKAVMDKHSAEYQAVLAEISKRNTALNADFATKVTALRQQQEQEITQARGQADVDRRAFEIGANKLKAYEEARQRYESQLAAFKEKEAQYQKQVDDGTAQLNALADKILVAEETKRAIKSLMSASFDEALDEIGDMATRIIRSIPNMANATIQFQGIKETQSGKVKEEVNAVISMDGEEGVDIRSLSGGERSSADLAIDLAVIDLIENRSNKGISIFILDEPFTGLDTVSIEMVLELLKNLKMNKKLIIVDHNPEVKEMVESRLIVVRDGLTSSISQAS